MGFSTGRLRCLAWSYSSVTEDDHHVRPVVCFPVADFEGGDPGAAGQARTPKMMCTMRLTSLKRFALRSKVTSTYLSSFLVISKARRVGVNSMSRRRYGPGEGAG